MTHDAETVEAQQATAADQYRDFVEAVSRGSRVKVETPNAIGDVDVSVFQADTLRAALSSIQPSVKDAATHWAITSPSGMHLGLWNDEETARNVFDNEVNGATLTPLRAISEGE